jgi:hypothetical protein
MNRLQKLAWYQLVVLIVWIAAMAITAAVVYYNQLSVEWIIIPLLFGVFIQFDRMFFPLRPGKIEYDERDAAIKQKALNIAYTTFWLTFVFGSLIAYFILGPMNSMPTGVFVIMILAGAILLRLVWSVAVIIQYGISSKEKVSADLSQAQGTQQ